MSDIDDIFVKIMEHTVYFDTELNEINLVDVNQLDWTGDSPLHIAARLGLAPAVPVLVKHGALVNVKGERGYSARKR